MKFNISESRISDICKENNIIYLGLFGSQSRGEARKDSDLDLLIDFDQTKSLFELSRLKSVFEKLFQKEIDITLRKNIKDTVKPFIIKDLNTLYGKRD